MESKSSKNPVYDVATAIKFANSHLSPNEWDYSQSEVTDKFRSYITSTTYHIGPKDQIPKKKDMVFCLHENNNDHDKRAIAVFYNGKKIGMLPRKIVPKVYRHVFSSRLPKGQELMLVGQVEWGWMKNCTTKKGRYLDNKTLFYVVRIVKK